MMTLLFLTECNNISERDNKEFASKGNPAMTESLLKSEPEEISFGEIKRTEAGKRSFCFKISNLSDSIFLIDKVDVSCNCVTVSRFPTKLRHGEEGEISGTIDFSKQKSHVRKSIFVNHNNGALKVLKITADIIDE